MLHKTKGENYLNIIIIPQIRAVARSVVGRYTPEQLYSTKRDAIQNEIFEETKKVVEDQYVQLNAVLVRDVTLPIAIREAIERKLNQEQEALEYEFRIEKATQEAERQRKLEEERIRLEAERARIEAERLEAERQAELRREAERARIEAERLEAERQEELRREAERARLEELQLLEEAKAQQQEALAKAAGMSTDEMSNMLSGQKDMEANGKNLVKDQEKGIAAMTSQVSLREDAENRARRAAEANISVYYELKESVHAIEKAWVETQKLLNIKKGCETRLE